MDGGFPQFLKRYPMHTYGKGEMILRPEHEENQIFFITSGFVRAHTVTEEGNEFSAVLLGLGMYFPVFRYLPDGAYTKNLTTKYYYSAVTETKIIIISNVEVIEFIRSQPHISVEMSDIYYLTIKSLLSKLEFMIYTHDAYKKVCYFLLFLCQRFGQKTSEGIKITPPFTHKEFATFVGLSRESVSHQLSLLKKQDIIDEFHQTILIKKVNLLEDKLRK